MSEKRRIRVAVNGEVHVREVEPRRLLVHHLREDLGLTGTHIGCDTSQCGACTVHVNGKAIKGCTMLAVEADGAEVTTIEGMANDDGSLSVIQAAFQENHGLQCGFCTPGMVMAVDELLRKNANPSEAKIRKYLSGNICRCTGYHNIIKSIQAAASQLG